MDYKAFAIENARREFGTRNVENECPACGCYLPSIGHLQSEYLSLAKHIFGIHGGNASRAQAAVGKRLIAAGFPTIPNIFGDITVSDKVYSHVGGR